MKKLYITLFVSLCFVANSAYAKTPSGDMTDWMSRKESFLLSNTVPQDASLNSGAWEHIENNIRNEVIKNGEAYVVTGPIYLEEKGSIGNGLKIPSHLYKIIYEPVSLKSYGFICRNEAVSNCKETTLNDLKQKTRINFFPSIS